MTAAGWRVPDDDDGRRSVGTEEIAALPPSLRRLSESSLASVDTCEGWLDASSGPSWRPYSPGGGIPLRSKRRKLRLVNLLWSDTDEKGRGWLTNGSRSTDRSRSIDETDCFVRLRKHAELVLQLRGVEATEDMFGLVFKAGTTSGSASRDAGRWRAARSLQKFVDRRGGGRRRLETIGI